MSTLSRDRLRLGTPKGVLLDRSASYPTLSAPHCQNTGPRPAWLLSKWHCAQDHALDQRYGLRCENYWQLFELQDGRCALCGSGPRRYRLVVHHDHQTGAVVCLLHFPCNRVIDPLLWLLPRLVALMVDPPGRPLGLVVPKAKRDRLEAKQRDKARGKTGPTIAPNGHLPAETSTLNKLRAMTKQGA